MTFFYPRIKEGMESSRGGGGQGGGGIQQLLAAEQEAQHIVNSARTGNFSPFFYSFFDMLSIWNLYIFKLCLLQYLSMIYLDSVEVVVLLVED